MHYEKIHYPDNEKVWMECYIQDSGLKLGQEQMRPAVVICPGGGYVYLSPREAEPVALAYAAKEYRHLFCTIRWDGMLKDLSL